MVHFLSIIMSTDSKNLPLCANCGKVEESSGQLKSCTACKIVKYCSRDCQKAHRSRHKKECRKRAVELYDEKLFKQPPPQFEACPICLSRMPTLDTGRRYYSCCGKVICSGCVYAGAKMDGNVDQLCPFCRAPAPTSEEEGIKQTLKRVEVGDALAIHSRAGFHESGIHGFLQDHTKALELWHRAGDLGCALSYCDIGNAHWYGRGVERDEKKANYYYELAAIKGCVPSRQNLGNAEIRAGNMDRALKHYMIAVGCGDNDSLKQIKQLYLDGCATKEDYAKALQAYQAYLVEIKSDGRDNAAAFDDECKYYE